MCAKIINFEIKLKCDYIIIFHKDLLVSKDSFTFQASGLPLSKKKTEHSFGCQLISDCI